MAIQQTFHRIVLLLEPGFPGQGFTFTSCLSSSGAASRCAIIEEQSKKTTLEHLVLLYGISPNY
jgi:hypothetical protein